MAVRPPEPRVRSGLQLALTVRLLRAAMLALLVGTAVLAVVLAHQSGSPALTLGAAVAVVYAALACAPLWMVTGRLAHDLADGDLPDAVVLAAPIPLRRPDRLVG